MVGMAKSLSDIAKALNLDSSTVSRAMTRPHKVAPETRKKILDYIEQVGFRPNLTARNLRKKCTYTIGIVVNDLCDTVIAKATSVMQEEAAKRGFFPIVLSTGDSRTKEREILERLFNSNVSGLVIIPSSATAELLSTLPKIPIVELDRSTGSQQFDEYRMDDVAAMQLATGYLQQQGCTNVAVLLGNVQRVSSFANRLAALSQCSSALNYLPYALSAIKTEELTAQACALTQGLLLTQPQWQSLATSPKVQVSILQALSESHLASKATKAIGQHVVKPEVTTQVKTEVTAQVKTEVTTPVKTEVKTTVKGEVKAASKAAKTRQESKTAQSISAKSTKRAKSTQAGKNAKDAPNALFVSDAQALAAQLLDLSNFDFAKASLNSPAKFPSALSDGTLPQPEQLPQPGQQLKLTSEPELQLSSKKVSYIHLMSLEQIKSSGLKLDAILATNNLLASGVLRACYKLGLEPQRDVQIFTFDNPDWLQVLPFKLPTITHPLEQAAYLAINRVLDRVEQKYKGDVEESLICPELLV